jgi:hypothetical protein
MINNTIPTALQLMNIAANFDEYENLKQTYARCLLHKQGYVYADDMKGYKDEPHKSLFQDIILESVTWQDFEKAPIRKRWKFTGSVWITN